MITLLIYLDQKNVYNCYDFHNKFRQQMLMCGLFVLAVNVMD